MTYIIARKSTNVPVATADDEAKANEIAKGLPYEVEITMVPDVSADATVKNLVTETTVIYGTEPTTTRTDQPLTGSMAEFYGVNPSAARLNVRSLGDESPGRSIVIVVDGFDKKTVAAATAAAVTAALATDGSVVVNHEQTVDAENEVPVNFGRKRKAPARRQASKQRATADKTDKSDKTDEPVDEFADTTPAVDDAEKSTEFDDFSDFEPVATEDEKRAEEAANSLGDDDFEL